MRYHPIIVQLFFCPVPKGFLIKRRGMIFPRLNAKDAIVDLTIRLAGLQQAQGVKRHKNANYDTIHILFENIYRSPNVPVSVLRKC